jgi:hypothetical protein
MAAVEGAPASSALPYVAWSSETVAVIPEADWPLVYSSLQALKGHVQEYPGCQKLEAFVGLQDGAFRIDCYTIWDTPEQLEAFLERGYTVERMLMDVAGIVAESSRVVEKVF